jgi:hypothetical protein
MKAFAFEISLLTLATMLLACKKEDKSIDEAIRGMWKLDKVEAYDDKTASWNDNTPYANSNGYILYDGIGHMGVHIIPHGYENFDTSMAADSLSAEKTAALMKFYQSNFVYFADYEIGTNTISHKRLTATEPVNWGSVLTRDVEFRGDTLLLTSKENVLGKKLRLHWVRY